MPKIARLKGFTLIELLVVVTILGVLAAIGLVAFSLAQKKAREVKIQADVNTMIKHISIARTAQQKTLYAITYAITGGGCTDCSCRSVPVNTTTTCVNTLLLVWSKITSEPLPKDPWENYYIWDENEGEAGNCTKDIIHAPGPDGLGYTADDFSYQVPFFNCPG